MAYQWCTQVGPDGLPSTLWFPNKIDFCTLISLYPESEINGAPKWGPTFPNKIDFCTQISLYPESVKWLIKGAPKWGPTQLDLNKVFNTSSKLGFFFFFHNHLDKDLDLTHI